MVIRSGKVDKFTLMLGPTDVQELGLGSDKYRNLYRNK